jgi:hypothetical protein
LADQYFRNPPIRVLRITPDDSIPESPFYWPEGGHSKGRQTGSKYHVPGVVSHEDLHATLQDLRGFIIQKTQRDNPHIRHYPVEFIPADDDISAQEMTDTIGLKRCVEQG